MTIEIIIGILVGFALSITTLLIFRKKLLLNYMLREPETFMSVAHLVFIMEMLLDKDSGMILPKYLTRKDLEMTLKNLKLLLNDIKGE